MKKEFIKASLQSNNDDVFTFVASDETMDRQGESLPIDAWDLRNYKKNPVLLVNHDYKVENIVGTAKKVRVVDGQLIFDAVFHEITALAKEVKEMVKQGFLNTVSVGFMRKPGKRAEDPMTNELFEVSFVPVPANPSAERIKALVETAAKEAKGEEVKEWVARQAETTEVQTVICAKDTFESAEEATQWVTDHDFKADKIDETADSYRFRQFSPDRCQIDSERTIDITEGVKAVICRPVKGVKAKAGMGMMSDMVDDMGKLHERMRNEMDDLMGEDMGKGIKEGRVLSGKNRQLIGNAVSAMKQAAEALDALLLATEAEPKSQGDGGNKGQDPQELQIFSEPNKAPKKVVRAVQDINKMTNLLLRELKR